MRLSLSWLDSECGGRLDRSELLGWLREAGADASLSGDAVEITVPPAFAHLASVRGVAAELRGRAGREPLPPPAPLRTPAGAGLDVQVDDGIPARVAAVSLTVPAGVRLPEEQSDRLTAAGTRVTGTVADLLAYVEWETGRPLGAVDARLVRPGGLRLRSVAEDEEIKIPGQAGEFHRAPAQVCLLTSGDEVLAAPGWSGRLQEIPAGGGEVLLYSWWLAPDFLRGIRTAYGPLAGEDAADAARTTDGRSPGSCDTAVARAAELAAAWAGAMPVAAGSAGLTSAERTLTVRTDALRQLIDPTLDTGRIVGLLRAAGLPARPRPYGGRADAELHISIPSERPDLDCVELIAGEAARMHGYRALTGRLSPPAALPRRTDRDRPLRRTVRDAAVRLGLQQVISPVLLPASSPLTHIASAGDSGDSGDSGKATAAGSGSGSGSGSAPIEVRGRVGLRHLRVRDTLLPSVLDVAGRSLQHTAAAHHFEIAPLPLSTTPGDESWSFTAVLGGDAAPPSLVAPDPRPVVFADLVALLNTLCGATARGKPELVPAPHPVLDPAASFTVRLGGRDVGRAGRVATGVLELLETPQAALFCADFDLGALGTLPTRHGTVHVPARVPLPAFNITVVAPESASAGEVLRVVAEAGGTPERLVRVKDMFQREDLGDGLLSMTVRAEFTEETGQGIKAQRRRRRELALDAVRERGWEGR